MTRGELVALVAWTPAETLAVAEAELAQIKEQLARDLKSRDLWRLRWAAASVVWDLRAWVQREAGR